MSRDGGRTTVSVPWLVVVGGQTVPEQADWVVWSQEGQFWLVSSELIGCFESLQGGGGELLDTPLGQEGALDGFELWSGLGVLQGRVGGGHCTLNVNSRMVIAAKIIIVTIQNVSNQKKKLKQFPK